MNRKLLIFLGILSGLIIILLGVYFLPVPEKPFAELYASVPSEARQSLQGFRSEHPPKSLEIDGQPWQYIVAGQGERNILFLHGMTGAYDIWWQQIEALGDHYRIVAVTYPPVSSLEGLAQGVLAILEKEGIAKVNLVGSSLGGYLTQYLVAEHPEIVEKAVFGNTFPPNDLIAEKNRAIGSLLPYLPEWLIMRTLRSNITGVLYPASGGSELLKAFQLEHTHGGMSKAQVIARYKSVIDPFLPPDPQAAGIPVLIIEADNDPLVEIALREQLKATYPSAQVQTLHGVGHFPYLSAPEIYTPLIEQFLAASEP